MSNPVVNTSLNTIAYKSMGIVEKAKTHPKKYSLVTFKDLKKRVTLETTAQQQTKLFERLLNKPFWIWDQQQHKLEDAKTKGDCCFNHIIGLPQKEAMDKPLYDYEKIIFDSLLYLHLIHKMVTLVLRNIFG